MKQHVVSRRLLERFRAGGTLLVSRRESNFESWFPASPDNPVFCATRAWDQKSERLLFKNVEDRFHSQLDFILRTGAVSDHWSVTEYLLMWQFRSCWAYRLRHEIELRAIESNGLTKDQEERLERVGVVYTRKGGTVPDRLFAHGRWALYRRQHKDWLSTFEWSHERVNDGLLIGDAPPGPALPVSTDRVLRLRGAAPCPTGLLNHFTLHYSRNWVARVAP